MLASRRHRKKGEEGKHPLTTWVVFRNDDLFLSDSSGSGIDRLSNVRLSNSWCFTWFANGDCDERRRECKACQKGRKKADGLRSTKRLNCICLPLSRVWPFWLWLELSCLGLGRWMREKVKPRKDGRRWSAIVGVVIWTSSNAFSFKIKERKLTTSISESTITLGLGSDLSRSRDLKRLGKWKRWESETWDVWEIEKEKTRDWELRLTVGGFSRSSLSSFVVGRTSCSHFDWVVKDWGMFGKQKFGLSGNESGHERDREIGLREKSRGKKEERS